MAAATCIFFQIMIEPLLAYDRRFFRIINDGWSNAFFDWLMPWLRNALMWYPLYLFLVLLVLINFRKTGWLWVLFTAGTIILCNFVSADILKENVVRLRPCNEPAYQDWIHVLVGYRPQSYSFVSSHASNHFGMAMFFYLTLRSRFRYWPALFFLWAFSISLAQVYVGVHYPLDVTCGALIGILIGYLAGRSFNRTYGLG